MPISGAPPQIDFIEQFKDVVREGVCWVWVCLAGVLFALALVLGGMSAARRYSGSMMMARGFGHCEGRWTR